MSTLIAWVLIAIAAGALILAMVLLWMSLSNMLMPIAVGVPRMDVLLSEQKALQEQKVRILRDLQELSFDFEAGKLSEEDYQHMNTLLRKDAALVMQRLEGMFSKERARAEAKIEAHLAQLSGGEPNVSEMSEGRNSSASPSICPQCTASNHSDTGFCSECGARVTPIPCHKCRVLNDADATFCKKCGAELLGKAKLDPA